ncbi:MAG: class II glutamine amidotransferase, partial [Xanthobacteraceae bacterium]
MGTSVAAASAYAARRSQEALDIVRAGGLTVDFSKETTQRDVVTVVATQALTRDEEWTPVPRRTLLVFQDGE